MKPDTAIHEFKWVKVLGLRDLSYNISVIFVRKRFQSTILRVVREQQKYTITENGHGGSDCTG